LNDWLRIASRSEAVCSFVGAMVMVNDFADRPARALNHRDILEIGRHRLRFLATPHVPHGWDAGMFFDETSRTLFCSDLFFHPGDPEPVIDTGIVARARDAILAGMPTPLAKDIPYTPDTDQTLQSLAELKPLVLATMHGSSFRGDGQKALLELASVIKETLGVGGAIAAGQR
jgi:flavorubredoxin